MSHKALAIHLVQSTPSVAPPSFGGDMGLYGTNLFLMTAITFLTAMSAGRKLFQIHAEWSRYRLTAPLTLVRLLVLFASLAACLRCGAEAALLWGWDPDDALGTANIIVAKRWIDPVAMACAAVWLTISLVGEPGIEHQLRNEPPPPNPWSGRRTLWKAAGVVGLSLIMALAAVWLR